MKVVYFWLIHCCLVFGIGVFCDKKLERRRTASYCIINSEDTFNCSNGLCIDASAVCDGHADCSDGSDETRDLCARQTCKSYEYRCQYGACVDNVKKCNGKIDCIDGSDENLMECKQMSINRTKHINGSSKCLHLCVLPTAEGIIYSYKGSNNVLPHGTSIYPRRIVIENCENGYYKAYPNSYRVCKGNGKWITNSEKLCFNCGKPYVKHQLLIDNGKTAHVGTAPWNVGIYRFNEDNSIYDLICGGSIIAPNLVVSAAHCFWQEDMISNIISINDDLYKIAVGKYNRDLTVIDNDLTQIMNVQTIYLKEDYYGYNRFYSDDIAVIVLKNRISISSGVAPVCVDWSSKYNVQNGDQGKIVGWGKTEKDTLSPILLEATLPYIDHNSCRSMYTNGFQIFVTIDKFCAGSPLVSGPGVCEGDSGSGLTFLHSGFYYLTGIVSLKDPNTNNSIAVFTDVKHHIRWLHELYKKYTSYESNNTNNTIDKPNLMVTKNVCVLPTAKGVIYSYEGSDKILSHGTLINPRRIIIQNCEIGYYKAYPNSFRVCQGNGKWISNSEKLCFKMCPPLLSDNIDFKCTLNGKFVNCSNPSIPDTLAIPSCKESHTVPINEQEETPNVLFCQSNGTWSKQLNRCISYCGRVYNDGKTLINNGKTSHVGTAPWNVGIYKFNKESFMYDLICGGSIISPNLVVSAAHCFWQKDMVSNIISINDGLYKVAVGKYNRDLTLIDNGFTQIMNAETIYLKEDYYGYNRFYSDDIAVIVLKNRISISNGVAPVCVDWSGRYNLSNAAQGKVVGWGKMENGTLSPILLEASLPYIDHRSCRNIYTNGFKMFVTYDKFCASFTLGQGVYQGDNGAGLTVLHSNYYYLTGVVSVKDSSTNNSIAVFTNVKHHIQWLHVLYNKYMPT